MEVRPMTRNPVPVLGLALALLIAGAVAGAAQPTEEGTRGSAADLSARDTQFLRSANSGGLLEVRLGEAARQKARDDSV
jgi:predicted outer membrane protein